MSRLSDLLRIVGQLDPGLSRDLEEEIKPLQQRLPFGLNFERHAPEAVELPGHKIRRASKVRVLPPRGSTDRGDQRIWYVEAVQYDVADITTPNGARNDTLRVPVKDLVLVAEFRDRIYPGLRPDGTVERGGDKPFHTVINGENFHALELLTFTHEHAVDAIYIDPPYNTGSRDWKYDNDYVEGDDLYRHSKWLAFMERRLKLAKRLLNPEGSVLIVTIDEKEYLRLGLLLEQTFPEASQQMVTIIMSSFGSPRAHALDRVDEYAFFLYFGEAAPARVFDDLLGETKEFFSQEVRWESLLRSGSGFRRQDRPNLFYPVFVSKATGEWVGFGDSKPADAERDQWTIPDGCGAFWPTRKDGSDGRWQVGQSTLIELFEQGYAKLGGIDLDNARGSIYYLTKAQRDGIRSGDITVKGHDEDGAVIIEHTRAKRTTAKSVWNRPSHAANLYGTSLVKNFLGGRTFPYPKSLYAVEDALRLATMEKPDAVVLDFFSGSGTTAHAVMRLNKQDDGRRQCISVTNNEVSADEQSKLRKRGLRPGDPEWEQWGICDYVTKPRIRAAITGLTPEGEPIKGDYRFVDQFPMSYGFEENAAFFTLTYESPWMVSNDRAFAAIAPMLWLRAGAVGERIDSIEGGWALAASYGIIQDLDLAADFIAELGSRDGVRLVYVVTDDEGRYQQVADEIPGIETVRLYEDYLRNCEMTGDFG